MFFGCLSFSKNSRVFWVLFRTTLRKNQFLKILPLVFFCIFDSNSILIIVINNNIMILMKLKNRNYKAEEIEIIGNMISRCVPCKKDSKKHDFFHFVLN